MNILENIRCIVTSRKMSGYKNKKGSYILEASIIMPIFIIGTLILMSVVSVMRTCDGINYSVCDELSKIQGQSIYMPYQIKMETNIKDRIKKDLGISNFSVNQFQYKYKNFKKDDLIRIKTHTVFSNNSILDINENITFNENIVVRAFTGTTRDRPNMTEDEFEKNDEYIEVYVFPNAGTKYHSESCTYITSKPYQCILTSEMKKRLSPCKVCKSKSLDVGALVCCFKYGDAYHTVSCKTIDKCYIKMDKQDAIKKGYTACQKCGGGGK